MRWTLEKEEQEEEDECLFKAQSTAAPLQSGAGGLSEIRGKVHS
jgi:hypothetical protein